MGITYNDIKIEGKTKFSPSGFANFYENPKYWYEQQITKENIFRGNTNTVVGTFIHSRIEEYYLKGIDPSDGFLDSEMEYLNQYKDVVEVDEWQVVNDVTRLWSIVKQHCDSIDKPSSLEESVVFEIPNTDYYIAGTYDYMIGTNILGDYKTASTTPKKIKLGHKIQLYIYSLAMAMNGKSIDEIEVTYIVKLKKQPKVITFREPIDMEFQEFVKSQVKDMVTRLDMIKDNPELVDVLFFENKDSYLR